MNSKELHRIAFMIGYDFHRSPTENRIRVLSYQITGLESNFTFNNDTTLDDVLYEVRKWGQKTINRIMEAGERWSNLSDYARALVLDDKYMEIILDNPDLARIYRKIYGDLLSSRSRYALNFFFEAPLSKVLNKLIVDTSRHLFENSDNGKVFHAKKINRKYVASQLMLIANVIRTFFDVGQIDDMARVTNNIKLRIGLSSRIVAAMYLSPLIVFIPILLFGTQVSGVLESGGVGGNVGLYATFSGLLPAVAIVLKFLYDYLVPRAELNRLEKHLQDLKLVDLFHALFEDRLHQKQLESLDRYNLANLKGRRIKRIFDWTDFRISYSISMYLFSANKVGSWKQYADQFLGKTGRVPI